MPLALLLFLPAAARALRSLHVVSPAENDVFQLLATRGPQPFALRRYGDVDAALAAAIAGDALMVLADGTRSVATPFSPAQWAALAAAPLSGASMNPIRSITPDLASVNFRAWYVYLVGPLVGMLFAVAMAWVLRGSGRDQTAAAVAQGSFVEEIASKALKPDQP